MLKTFAWIVGGIVLLVWMSGAFAGSDTPSQTTPSDSAQTSTGPPPAADQSSGTSSRAEVGAEGESQRTYHVPTEAMTELQQDSAAIEVQKSIARQLENQLNEAKSALADQKARAEALQHQLDLLKKQLDKARQFVDPNDSLSVFNFSSQVEKYNDQLRQVQGQWKNANALGGLFNDLVNKVNAQNHIVNEMVDAYNAKLRRVGY
jgi:hypothetical protein